MDSGTIQDTISTTGSTWLILPATLRSLKDLDLSPTQISFLLTAGIVCCTAYAFYYMYKKLKQSTSSKTNRIYGAKVKVSQNAIVIFHGLNIDLSESATGIVIGIIIDAEDTSVVQICYIEIKNESATGSTIGLKVDARDNSEIKTGNIFLIVGFSKSQLKEDI